MKHDDMPEKIYAAVEQVEREFGQCAEEWCYTQPSSARTEYIRKSTADAALLNAKEALETVRRTVNAGDSVTYETYKILIAAIAQIDSLIGERE